MLNISFFCMMDFFHIFLEHLPNNIESIMHFASWSLTLKNHIYEKYAKVVIAYTM